MTSRIVFCLALFMFNLPGVLRADMCIYDSVEWMTAMGDQIGIYHAEKMYGPHSVTNDPQHWSCCFCTAEFTLQKPLRGDPPTNYSRTLSVDKPEALGFHVCDTYIFFFANESRRTNVVARPSSYSTGEIFFSMWNYIWLERPQGERNGVAIDREGRVLTNRSEIVKLVETSLKLPRAAPEIDRWTYFYYNGQSNGANFNFQVVDFPAPKTSVKNEPWTMGISWQGLVIPKSLYQENSVTNNIATRLY